MKICAIVLNYRNAARTQNCLRSLIGQGLNRVLVVDNSGDDDAASELAAMMERQRVHMDTALHLLDPKENLGFARGVNLALNNAGALHYDAFLIINNDAVAMSGMVTRLSIALFDSSAAMVAPVVIDAAGKLLPMFWYQRFFGLLTVNQWPGSFPYLSGCCLLVSHDMLVDGRLFDEDFFMYGEDTLLGWRLARAGGKPLLLADAFVRHEGAGSSRRGQLFYEYHLARAHILLARKTWRYPMEIPFMLICKCAVLSVRALWRSLSFWSVVPIKAFFMAWRELDIRVP